MTKTYPLVFSTDFHKKLVEAAEREDKSLKQWLMEAIEEKLKQEKKSW